MTLLAAASAGVRAIDSAHPRDPEFRRLEAETAAARRFGLAAKLALDPAQAAIINEVFAGAPDPARPGGPAAPGARDRSSGPQ